MHNIVFGSSYGTMSHFPFPNPCNAAGVCMHIPCARARANVRAYTNATKMGEGLDLENPNENRVTLTSKGASSHRARHMNTY